MEKKIAVLEKTNESNMLIQKEGIELQNKLDSNEQHARANNIEITGIPESKQENLIEAVNNIFKELSLDQAVNIEYATRVTPWIKLDGRPWNMGRREVKDNILAAIRTKKGLTMDDIKMKGKNKIFMNEHLTPKNKMIFKKVRDFTKLQFCWVKNCKIFIRLNESTNHICINSENDLIKINKYNP